MLFVFQQQLIYPSATWRERASTAVTSNGNMRLCISYASSTLNCFPLGILLIIAQIPIFTNTYFHRVDILTCFMQHVLNINSILIDAF